MKLQIMSDLHLEMHRDKGKEFIAGLDGDDVDVLVLAGDIVSAAEFEPMRETFARFLAHYPHVLYVLGNHEYYGTTPAAVQANIDKLIHWADATANLDVLHPGAKDVTIQGQRFLGGTLWFSDDPMAACFKPMLNDFRMIIGFEPWVYDQNAILRKHLSVYVEPTDVVVTHYLPTYRSVAPQFERSGLNAFFVSDMLELIVDQRPKLWVHGHTHGQNDYIIGDTRIISNPFGYPNELKNQKQFREKLVVEV